jgi:hypothetical protein
MKTLRSISTAVLLCLVLAAPAAATTTPNISVSVSASSATLGTPVSYTVSGEGEARQMFAVRVMSLASYPASECVRSNERSQLIFEAPGTFNGSGAVLHQFNENREIPAADYNALGTYAVCAVLKGTEHDTESAPVTFSVVAPAPLVQATPQVTPPAATPSVAPLPPAPVATPSVVASTSVQKLHKALAKCKKQKNKKKRAKCERVAKAAARR